MRLLSENPSARVEPFPYKLLAREAPRVLYHAGYCYCNWLQTRTDQYVSIVEGTLYFNCGAQRNHFGTELGGSSLLASV